MQLKALILLILVLPVLIVAPVLLFTVAGNDQTCNTSGVGSVVDPGTVPQGPVAGYGHEQLVNAAQIMSAAASLGLSVRDQQIGVMTAMGESSLLVLDYGDTAGPDSRGLFQQRDNGAWGSYADRLDPYRSALSFFRVLATITGRESMEPTLVANAVQRNADPYHYTRWWEPAGQVVQTLRGVVDATPTTPSTATQYSVGDVQPQTAVVANTIGQMFGIRSVGGWRAATSVYDDLRYGHSVGLALDFMISDIDNGPVVGDQVATYLQQNAASLGVAYIIWQQAIWSPDRAGEGWRPMADRGSATQNHMDHVHLSLTGAGSLVDPCTPGGGAAVSAGGWAWPADGTITSWFGENRAAYGMHYGLDIGAPCGTPIRAAGTGTVEQAGPASGYGNWIVIDHGGGLTTTYGHMYADGVGTHAGATVAAGEQIGAVGSAGQSSGCHLHFQVETNRTPIDPIGFLADRGVHQPGASQ